MDRDLGMGTAWPNVPLTICILHRPVGAADGELRRPSAQAVISFCRTYVTESDVICCEPSPKSPCGFQRSPSASSITLAALLDILTSQHRSAKHQQQSDKAFSSLFSSCFSGPVSSRPGLA